MSGMARPAGLHKLYCMNGPDKVTYANALVHALILIAKVSEEGGHDLLLELRAQKYVREAAAGDWRRNLW